MGGHLLIGDFDVATDGRQIMVAPLDQFRDLLLHPQLPRTTTRKPKCRGEAKRAENPNGTACSSTSSTRRGQTWSPASLSHIIAEAAPWASLCPLSATEARKGRGRTHPPPCPTSAPHQRDYGGRRKGEGFKHHSQSFPLETGMEGWMEGGRWVGPCIVGEHPAAPGATAVMGCQQERQVSL